MHERVQGPLRAGRIPAALKISLGLIRICLTTLLLGIVFTVPASASPAERQYSPSPAPQQRLTPAPSVGKWHRYVVSIRNDSFSGNPFELALDATFTHKSSGATIKLPGYYAGNNTWKVGFMPTRTGEWTYVTSSSDPDLDDVTGSLTAVESGHPGMLKADSANPRKWKYVDGPYVAPIALRFDVFHEDGTIERFAQVADFLKEDVGGHLFEFTFRNEVYSDWQKRQFDLALWDRLEERMDVLTERGLGIHFMVYSDDSQRPAWPAQSDAEKLLIRYLVARLAGYPVVWYNTGIDIAENRGQAWINWYGQQVRALDPYGHPISSRYGGGSGDLVMSGQTFDSRGDRLAIISDMTRYFKESRVPVSMDDAWSENSPEAARRGKDFTEHDIRRAVWKTVMAGGLGSLIRGSTLYNNDLWFRMRNIESELESEQYLRLVNWFIQNKLGNTFGSMVPEASLVSNGYALADPGRTRLLYFLMGVNDRYDSGNGGSVTLKLSGLNKTYEAIWFDPRTGNEARTGSIRGAQDHTLAPPSKDDWVLLLSASGSGDPATATPTPRPSATATRTPAPIATPRPGSGNNASISGVSAASRASYQVVNGLERNAQVYIDRGYTFTSVPQAIYGASYIKTANDDKNRTEESFLSFTVDRTVTVYVAYDARARSLPNWLSGWNNTGLVLGTTDTDRKLYSRVFPAGKVTLGANLAPGASGAASNYTVVIVAGGTVVDTPTPTPTAVPTRTATPVPTPTASPTPRPGRPTLDVQASTVAVLDTVSIPIVLSEAPTGVSGFDLDVTLSDPAVARISDIQFPGFGISEHEMLSSARARLRAVDSEDAVESGARNVVLATVGLQGLAQGTTSVTVRILRLDDDRGNAIQPEYTAGTLRVVSPTCPTLPGAASPSRDLDGDGRCEDANGNGRLDFDDVVDLFDALDSSTVTENATRFDFNGNGGADMADIVKLFDLLTS